MLDGGGQRDIAEGGDVALKSEFNFGWATLTSYSAAQWTSGTEAAVRATSGTLAAGDAVVFIPPVAGG